MSDQFDVVVVGARCAGSPLAAQLARAGLSVCLVDKATFPSDTLSTHVFQRLDCFERLGVMDALRATDAPLMTHMASTAGDVDLSTKLPAPWMCIRRPVLDTILLEHAMRSGADVRTGVRVADLVERDGRVSGVRVEGNGRAGEIRARLVVGADGVRSTVGRLVGARRYHVLPGERCAYWGYYEGATPEATPTMHLHRFGDAFVLAAPADAGLHLAIAVPPLDQAAAFVGDSAARWDAYVKTCQPVAAILKGATPIARPHVMRRWTGFFRESAGPGWVLVGDAGHFKDPGPGQGISDALRQVEALVPAITAGFDGADQDQQLRAWWRWRDDDAFEMHWFALDINRAGPVPLPLLSIFRHLAANPERLDQFWRLFSHRGAPSRVLTPPRLMSAAAKLLASGRQPRGRTLREVKTIIATDRHRRKLAKHPQWEDGEMDHVSSGLASVTVGAN